MNFSQRNGLKPIKPHLQIDSIDSSLRSTLWNIFYDSFFSYYHKSHMPPETKNKYYQAIKIIWFRYLKLPVDDLAQTYKEDLKQKFKNIFLEANYNEVYDFLEYFMSENFGNVSIDREQYARTLNFHLRENNSAYRIIDYCIAPITNQVEIDEIGKLNSNTQKDKLIPVNKHMKSSLTLMSNKQNPDYRNSIKESISMIESLTRVIYPDTNSLGKALKKLKDANILDQTLINGFDKIYGYSNGKDGIRHAILDSSDNIAKEDAQYFLVSCSAFANYIIEKARINSLL